MGEATVINGLESGIARLDLSTGAAALPYYVSALLPSELPRWNEASGIGTAVDVTFSFMTGAPSDATVKDQYGFGAPGEAGAVQPVEVRPG
jgi:hypothetical protein